ncbi:N-acetyltransferase [Paraburkholderia fungorum]|uniref:GNAT family N-acetyltransferase n=1 Tax=Paraburkholderia fungorum TaxID=134537 RepID=UPI00048149AB|nr:GNAT family protein [Paraburkholderia fungorum]PNE56896.1 N-acetyltransferase [Paraburkholderia fungorum]USU14741.1 GNAT family N-acetyltransferase [Paraburkholderia fungorum]USU22689.1 GNAT family N-acetyltransferase [Paraburkholderia fungorum]
MSSQDPAAEPAHRTDGSHQTGGESGSCWLREPDSDDVNDIAAWLADQHINQWFDFGQGRQTLSVPAVRFMIQGGRHRIRMFGPAGHEAASGLVAASDLAHAFGTGSFWVLRDSRRPACRDMTFTASTRLLREAFEADRLHCITAWAVECNVRSRHLLERIGFRLVGLQRDCHVMHGSRYGRVHYDLLPADLAADTGSPQRGA